MESRKREHLDTVTKPELESVDPENQIVVTVDGYTQRFSVHKTKEKFELYLFAARSLKVI